MRQSVVLYLVMDVWRRRKDASIDTAQSLKPSHLQSPGARPRRAGYVKDAPANRKSAGPAPTSTKSKRLAAESVEGRVERIRGEESAVVRRSLSNNKPAVTWRELAWSLLLCDHQTYR